MKNLVTKKNIIIALGVSAVLLAVLQMQWIRTFCYDNDLSCVSLRGLLLPLAWGCFPISIAFYFLRDEIFRSWLKFIAWWLPVGTLLVFAESGGRGSILGVSLFPAQLFALTIVIESLLLFTIKMWELRRADQGNLIAWWVKWSSHITSFVLSVALSYYIYGLF
jgi:hypothetical protein